MVGEALMNTYGDRSVTLVKGEGCWLWDSSGKKYLDSLSGIAVCGLGHGHGAITSALAEQASKLNHCSNFFDIPGQRELAEKLCAISGMSKVFFGNSGAEANEAAIKIARLYGKNRNIKTPTVIVMDNAFHGRTITGIHNSHFVSQHASQNLRTSAKNNKKRRYNFGVDSITHFHQRLL